MSLTLGGKHLLSQLAEIICAYDDVRSIVGGMLEVEMNGTKPMRSGEWYQKVNGI